MDKKKKEKGKDPNERKQKPTKEDMESSFSLSIPLGAAVASKYNCFEDIVTVFRKRDLGTIFEFLFHKFPWYELLTRILAANRDKLERLGEDSSFYACLNQLNVNQLFAAYINFKNLILNPQWLLSVIPQIPEIPQIPYIPLVDFWAFIKAKIIELIIEALLLALESLLGFAIRDLLNMCNLSDEDINRLASQSGGGGDPYSNFASVGDGSKLDFVSCDINVLIQRGSQFSLKEVLFLLQEQFPLLSGLSEQELRGYFDIVSENIDSTELVSLLRGFANDGLLEIVADLGSISQLSFKEGVRDFYKHLGTLVNSELCITGILEDAKRAANPCPPQDIKVLLAQKGLPENYKDQLVEDALSNIEELCKKINDTVYDLSKSIPNLIGQQGRKALQAAVDAPFKALEGQTKSSLEQTTDLIGTKIKSLGSKQKVESGPIKLSLESLYWNNPIDESEKPEDGSILFDLIGKAEQVGSELKGSQEFSVDGKSGQVVLKIGGDKGVAINEKGEVLYNGQIVVTAKKSAKEADYIKDGVVNTARGFISDYELKDSNEFSKKTIRLIDEDATRVGLVKALFNTNITTFPLLQDLEKGKEFVKTLFDLRRFGEGDDVVTYKKTFQDSLNKSGDASKGVENVLLYKEVLKRLES